MRLMTKTFDWLTIVSEASDISEIVIETFDLTSCFD